MKPPTEEQAAGRIGELLADLLGVSAGEVLVRWTGPIARYDFAMSTGHVRFLAEYKSYATSTSVAAAIASLKQCSATEAPGAVRLVIVPFMGPAGKQLCEESGTAWMDLSGNARIIAPGVCVRIEGRPNAFVARGRPANVFAPRSSRLARQLLLHPRRFQSQAELARATGLGDGYVSTLVRRLASEEYTEADARGAIRPRDPGLLLDAWRESYDFEHHRAFKGHAPARSGDELVRRLVQALSRDAAPWAFTGLSAAWFYTQFAAFRLVTVYLSSLPSRSLIEELDFSPEAAGANLWLVLPDDPGVFQGGQAPNGVPCVSPIQTYLDLKEQPERAADAAAELRRRLLSWGQDER